MSNDTNRSDDAASAVVPAEAEKRGEYIAGLRMLADVLEQNPDLILPFDGSGTSMNVIPVEDQKAQVALWARVMPGVKQKGVRGSYFDLHGSLRGLKVQVIASRDAVCDRVVTGTETITKTVPDPDVKVPLVTVTETVETVAWVCRPLLGSEDES